MARRERAVLQPLCGALHGTPRGCRRVRGTRARQPRSLCDNLVLNQRPAR